MNTICFDLLDAQQKVREIRCPKELFETWERLSCAYLRKELSSYMLDEMKTIVWKQFRLIRLQARALRRAAQKELKK